MLTTSRRTLASVAMSAASARPTIAPTTKAAIHIARFALMSSSVVLAEEKSNRSANR
jgi:hypothetical protein